MATRALHVPVYVVSIDDDRYTATERELHTRGFAPRLYRGVDGRTPGLRECPDVTPFARHCCTDKMLGCALSHLRLARQLTAAWPDGALAVLVVEDDVLVKSATPADVAELAASAADWDIRRLYCQGRCAPTSRLFAGSTAAYLLSRHGARKLARQRAVYHIDMQQSARDLRTLNGPQLFSTRDARCGPLVGDQSLSFWLGQPVLRTPGFGQTVSLAGALAGLLGAACLGFWYGLRQPRVALVGACAVAAALVALYERAYGYSEVQRGRRRAAATLTLAAGSMAGILAEQMGGGRMPLHWGLPLLFVLENTTLAGLLGLASVH